MATYRILSMDGGGVRGILTARFLEKIAARYPDFLAKADLIAGTSAGSINAIGLALGLTPAQVVNLYRTQCRVIFHDTLWHEIGDLWGVTGARYTTDGRYEGIHPAFGDTRLGDIAKRVLVAAFALDSESPISPARSGTPRTWKAKFFHNFPQDNDGSPNTDLNHRAIEVVLRSSAAPTFFPIYEGFVDGGVVANSPSLCALAQALNVNTGQQQIESLRLLSIGTGGKRKYLKSADGNWGLSQWGFNLIDLLLETGADLADYQCRQLLADRYLRLDAVLKENIGLDAVDEIETLLQVADTMADRGDLQPCFDWIEAQWLPDA